MRPREHLSDIRRAWLGTWFDVRQLWRDRQDILFDPRGALWGEIPLGNRPWPFAVQAMLLPSTIVAAALAIVFVFVDLPPTPAERIISLLTARIERAAGRLSEYDLLSNGAQRPELEKLSLDELRRREDALTAQLAMERGGQPSLTTIHARRAIINEINLRHYFELA